MSSRNNSNRQLQSNYNNLADIAVKSNDGHEINSNHLMVDMPEDGGVSFESKETSTLDYDQVCLKVCLHPLHFIMKKTLQTYYQQNGITNNGVGKILQNKNTLTINVLYLTPRQEQKKGVLVIANKLLIVLNKEEKTCHNQPVPIDYIKNLTLSLNESTFMAFEFDVRAQMGMESSHLIFNSVS